MNDRIAELVLPHTCRLAEGPLWDHRDKNILWLDILAGEIHRYNTITGTHRTFQTGHMIGSIALRRSGGIIAAMQNGFSAIDLDKETIEPIADPEAGIPGNRFNDGKCDPAGRFWAGTMALSEAPGAGTLYTLDADHSISVKIKGTSISNGMAWSLDHKTFYYIDTPTMQVAAYDYDAASGGISNPRVAINVSKADGHPDGMTIDNEGMLWIAHWGGWQVTRRNPLTGELLLRVPLPVERVSCCTFGGDNLQDLYITSAREGLTEQDLAHQPLAGSLFVIRDCGFTGLRAYQYKG